MRSYSIYRVAETISILVFVAMVILLFNFYPVTALMLVFIALLDDIPVMTIAYDHTEKGKPTTKMGYVSSSRNGNIFRDFRSCIFPFIILYR